ncbi:MAG: helix-turn-helix domain-containing protein [Bacillota bacterium]
MERQQEWPEVMSVPEAARYMRLDGRTVRKLISEGKIRAARAGRVWRVAKKELDRFLRGGITDE